VLDTLDRIAICTGYECDGDLHTEFPGDVSMLERVTPRYEWMEGWQTSTKLAQDIDELPKRARIYLQKLAQLSGAKLSIVSVGARREETMFL